MSNEERGLIKQYHTNRKKMVNSLMGKVMKETKGKANPEITKAAIEKRLDAIEEEIVEKLTQT